MATIKSYTDIEQSKKLAEILPHESADMHFINDKHAGCVPYLEMTSGSNPWLKGTDISPCWSLAALLSVLPFVDFTTPQLIGTPKTLYMCKYNDDLKSHVYDNAVDACYDMIIKLHELNFL